MDGYGVGVGFGGTGNRGAANGMGGGRDGRKGPLGGFNEQNGRRTTNEGFMAFARGGSLNRSTSRRHERRRRAGSAQDIRRMDARFGSVENYRGQVGVLARDQRLGVPLYLQGMSIGIVCVEILGELLHDEIIADGLERRYDPFGN